MGSSAAGSCTLQAWLRPTSGQAGVSRCACPDRLQLAPDEMLQVTVDQPVRISLLSLLSSAAGAATTLFRVQGMPVQL